MSGLPQPANFRPVAQHRAHPVMLIHMATCTLTSPSQLSTIHHSRNAYRKKEITMAVSTLRNKGLLGEKELIVPVVERDQLTGNQISKKNAMFNRTQPRVCAVVMMEQSAEWSNFAARAHHKHRSNSIIMRFAGNRRTVAQSYLS